MSGELETPTLSKNQLKKLKRDQAWEENRAKRKAKRKEKTQERKQRKRVARNEANLVPSAQQINPQLLGEKKNVGLSEKPKRSQSVRLPITLVLDCGFDDLMMDKERTSLGSQLTRCYSDNHKAPFEVHLAVSSFGGHLKERFDGVLAGQYQSWKNVRFLESDFVEAATQAKQWMKEDQGTKIAGTLADMVHSGDTTIDQSQQEGEVVYLTSDSPETLTELRPFSTYIIGGLVDRNRHKGICYKKARDRGIKTAKLPIGDYMQMTSRFVLATNHVTEIMLRWLELGDWGQAFLQVVPKRKGGVLKEGLDGIDEGAMDEGRVDEGKNEEADEMPPRDGETTSIHQEAPTLASDAVKENEGDDEMVPRSSESSSYQNVVE